MSWRLHLPRFYQKLPTELTDLLKGKVAYVPKIVLTNKTRAIWDWSFEREWRIFAGGQ